MILVDKPLIRVWWSSYICIVTNLRRMAWIGLKNIRILINFHYTYLICRFSQICRFSKKFRILNDMGDNVYRAPPANPPSLRKVSNFYDKFVEKGTIQRELPHYIQHQTMCLVTKNQNECDIADKKMALMSAQIKTDMVNGFNSGMCKITGMDAFCKK